jgi:porin
VGFKKSHPTGQGLYAWGVFVANPDDDINLVPYWVSAGLTYKGLIPSREADRLEIGFYHGFFSSDSGLDDETQIEVSYRAQFTSWLGIGPDIQYIVNPGGSPDAGNAFVLGLNLTAFF